MAVCPKPKNSSTDDSGQKEQLFLNSDPLLHIAEQSPFLRDRRLPFIPEKRSQLRIPTLRRLRGNLRFRTRFIFEKRWTLRRGTVNLNQRIPGVFRAESYFQAMKGIAQKQLAETKWKYDL